MFKLATAATYWWPIVFRQPSQNSPGELVESSFEVQFRYLSNTAHQAMLDDVRANGTPDAEVVQRLVTDFRSIEDESGGPLKFTLDALRQLADVPGMATAIVRAYFASRSEAAAKN